MKLLGKSFDLSKDVKQLKKVIFKGNGIHALRQVTTPDHLHGQQKAKIEQSNPSQTNPKLNCRELLAVGSASVIAGTISFYVEWRLSDY